jgi:ComEC/Rec2-related protein
MRGTFFFMGVGVFALGVLLRTFIEVPWQCSALGVFFTALCFLFAFFEQKSEARTLAVAIACILLAGLFGIIRAAFAEQTLPQVFQPLINTHISLMGALVADPDVREKNQQLVVLVDEDNVRTRILAFAPLGHTYVYGEEVTVSGTLTLPAPFSTDTGRVFRYDHYLAKRAIFSDITRAGVQEVAPPEGFINACVDALFEIKHIFVRGLTRALPNPFGELATGLLTGDQHTIDDSILTMLELAGLVWVIVLSGYHVTIIAEGIMRAFSFLPRRFALMLAGLGVALIVFATGASAPSLRGSIMAGFALFAEGTGRRYDSLRALAATLVIVLLWNPLLLAYDQGFELSLIVTPAIILGMPLLEARLLWIKSKLLREVISVSVIAQLACLPLIVWQEGQLEVWAIPANMFVTAFVPLVMLLSVIAGFGGVLPISASIALLIGFPAYCLLYFILAVARISASLPYANLTVPPFSFAFVVIAYVLLIGIGWWMKTQLPASKDAGRLKSIIPRA